MKVVDAHIHINTKVEKPLEELISRLDDSQVEKCMLILNTPEERCAFENEINVYKDNVDRFWIACGLDIHNKSSYEDFERYCALGLSPMIKIHPSMFSISKEEIPAVVESVIKYECPIIVDSLYYGERIEFHNGIEMGVALARANKNRKVVMAHSGSLDFLKCMMSTRYMFNVYYDYSFIQNFFNHTSLRLDMVDFLRRTSNRILFGSDSPSFTIQSAKDELMKIAMEANLTDEQLENLFYKNAFIAYS